MAATETFTSFRQHMQGKRVTVIGIGISNRPVIDFLLKLGCRVSARDRKDAHALGETARQLQARGVELFLGEHYLDHITEEYIIKAPGIRKDLPELQKAVQNGSVLTSEMELFLSLCPAPVWAITGSDGKTTTTTLTYLLLREEFAKTDPTRRVFVGGNIGTPLLAQVEEIKENDAVVLELSSFQLHAMRCAPAAAAITNISPNHLNWHTDMAEYIAAKCNIFANQHATDRLVLNYDNEITRNIGQTATEAGEPHPPLWFSRTQTPPQNGQPAILLQNGDIVVRQANGTCNVILPTSDILLPGVHNIENYMTAIALTLGYVSTDTISHTARTFKGVAHRCELVRETRGIQFYNSSIDSSPTRTIAAIESFPKEKKLIVILGGYDKNIPFDTLGAPLSQHARAVVLTGATAPKIAAALHASPAFCAAGVAVVHEPDFENAIDRAVQLARPGDAVILSPACASFDAFENFEARGEAFRAHVMQL